MEKVKLTGDKVASQIKCFLEMLKRSGDFFDVDMLIFYVTRHIWDDLFTYDSDSQTDFLTGVMKCCQDPDFIKVFGSDGCVILFLELSDWAKDKFHD